MYLCVFVGMLMCPGLCENYTACDDVITARGRTIDCHNRSFKSVPDDLPTDDIASLLLNDNWIKEIKNDTFINFTSLVHLNLQDNVLMLLESAAFHGLNHLTELDLSRNYKFPTWPDNSIKGLSGLVELRLSATMVFNDEPNGPFPPGFRGMTSLKRLSG